MDTDVGEVDTEPLAERFTGWRVERLPWMTKRIADDWRCDAGRAATWRTTGHGWAGWVQSRASIRLVLLRVVDPSDPERLLGRV